MGRTKYEAREELLNFPVRTRVTEVTYKRLEKLVTESSCQSVGEVARKILSREKDTLLLQRHYHERTNGGTVQDPKRIESNRD